MITALFAPFIISEVMGTKTLITRARFVAPVSHERKQRIRRWPEVTDLLRRKFEKKNEEAGEGRGWWVARGALPLKWESSVRIRQMPRFSVDRVQKMKA